MKFGSQIQRDVGLRTLGAVLQAWKSHAESMHRKNRVDIVFENAPGRPLPADASMRR
jgi:hypothetical protein